MGLYGNGTESIFLETDNPLSGVDFATSDALSQMLGYPRVGAQLIVDPLLEDVTLSASDGVVAGTKTFTITEFDFTGLVGATLTISGAANPGNNGTFVVSSVTSAHVVVCSTATGLVDETFSSSVALVVTFPLLTGDWKIEVSNDYTPTSMAGSYNQDADDAGHWTDITSEFSPSIAPVATATASSYNQYVQADLAVRAIRFSFTSATGHGFPAVYGQMITFA